MKNDEKCCENCAFYTQHYAWSANQFVKICCGHCINRNLTAKEKRSFPFIYGCAEWQPKEKEIARQQESLKEILNYMAKRLDEIKKWLELNS